MVFAEDIRKAILELAEARGSKHTFASEEVAQAVDKNNWSTLLEQVLLVAGTLVKEGKIVDVSQKEGESAFRKT